MQFIHNVNVNGSKSAKKSYKVILPSITSPECHCTAE